MGSYSQITFADYPIFEYKNSYDEKVVNLIFQPEDFVIEKKKNSSRNKVVWGDVYENNNTSYWFKGFRQTVKICKERLEIYGSSLKKAKKDFSAAKKIARQEEFYSFSFKGITYDMYLEEIKSIIDAKEKRHEPYSSNLRESLSFELGIIGQSLELHLYSILSVLPEDEIVEYDLTEIINGGWVNEDDVRNIDIEKIIILAEGKTDIEFISKSIKKFYPYLFNYYHFIDFEGYKVESNASALVKLVSSFAAANVKHPIIALFDNDTAGLMEMKNLTSKSLPHNFKVIKYPNIDLAKKYPTIGATGQKKMNVNSLACGIEMYFGIDALTKDGCLIPIHWKSYNEKEKRYQGEILDKKFAQKKFRAILNGSSVQNIDEMNLLLREIFKAFSS